MKWLRKKLRAWRRASSRNESMVRWLGLSRVSGAADEPGLLLIQIDGLSRTQLELAMRRRRMPFLSKLMRNEHFKLHTMYSGVPSTTPAVQGELFYGVRCAVPAFSFKDPATGVIVRMVDSEPAAAIEARLAAQQEGLLATGSAYSNIYTGGAAEPHFCAASMGWNGMFSQATWLTWMGIVLWNWFSIARTLVLMLLEVAIGLYDAIVGHWTGQKLDVELKYVPSRVAVSIGLRELITIGASMDVTRGQAVVQLNFLGYDEQAHRRGPSSAFAHWSLKGIDDAIKRVVKAARASERRKYEVWIYSDHGQEHVVAYDTQYGRSIQEAVTEVLAGFMELTPADRDGAVQTRQPTRVRWIGGFGRRLSGGKSDPPHEPSQPKAVAEIIAIGPVGHVYFAEDIDPEMLAQIAEQLVASAHVPTVLWRAADGGIAAQTTAGQFALPGDVTRVVGDEHPFLDDLADDLVELCDHEAAGQLVLLGWSAAAERPLSFAHENGAHAGPGTQETEAFILAPAARQFHSSARTYLRPNDLRLSALRQLGRGAACDMPAVVAGHEVE